MPTGGLSQLVNGGRAQPICPNLGGKLPIGGLARTVMATDAPDLPIAPTLLDPRLLLLVPAAQRPAIRGLWTLEGRLFAAVANRREDMLAQIKLAWWRDRLAQLASDPGALPKGEPLLAKLAQHDWPAAALQALPDAFEAAMLAHDRTAAFAAAEQLATTMQGAMQGAMGGVATVRADRWALVRVGQLLGAASLAQALWQQAGSDGAGSRRGTAPGDRAVHALDRWAALMGQSGGMSGSRREAWLLLRLGLGF